MKKTLILSVCLLCSLLTICGSQTIIKESDINKCFADDDTVKVFEDSEMKTVSKNIEVSKRGRILKYIENETIYSKVLYKNKLYSILGENDYNFCEYNSNTGMYDYGVLYLNETPVEEDPIVLDYSKADTNSMFSVKYKIENDNSVTDSITLSGSFKGEVLGAEITQGVKEAIAETNCCGTANAVEIIASYDEIKADANGHFKSYTAYLIPYSYDYVFMTYSSKKTTSGWGFWQTTKKEYTVSCSELKYTYGVKKIKVGGGN